MKTVCILVMLFCVSFCFGQSPSAKFVDSFLVGGKASVFFYGWTQDQFSFYGWRLNDEQRPYVCWFRILLTPVDSYSIPLKIGGIKVGCTKLPVNPGISIPSGASSNVPATVKTDVNGVAIIEPATTFACYDYFNFYDRLGISLKDKQAEVVIYWFTSSQFPMWGNDGIASHNQMNISQPVQGTQQMSEVLTQEDSSSEVWYLHCPDGDIMATSLVALPEADPNQFEKYATPYFARFEQSNSPDTIVKTLMGKDIAGLDLCTSILAHRVSGNLYQTEYIVLIENPDEARVYCDPNGVIYNFAYTATNFEITDYCEDNEDVKIQEFVEDWLCGGFPRSDFNYDGIVNLKDYAVLLSRRP